MNHYSGKNLPLIKLDFLEQTIAPVLGALSAVDFKAMRFEKDIVEFSIAQLRT